MRTYLGRGLEKLLDLSELSRDEILYRNLPRLVMKLLRVYFRLEVEGLENIPRKGPALITPNHSGYSGFDALIVAHEISHGLKRFPRVLTHHLWFLNQTTAIPMQKLGFISANLKNADAQLNRQNLVMVFPEGELGNFKPTHKMYQLQDFKRGFIRMAIQHGCPIIPVLVIGAEETHINLKQIRLPKILEDLVLPLPLNIFPLPVKWKIKFLEPIYLPYGPEVLGDRELMHELADDIRTRMQKELSKELSKRESIFFG